MFTTITIALGATILGKSAHSMHQQYKINNPAFKNLLATSHDTAKKLETRSGRFKGSNTVFSLTHPTALHNKIKIHKYEDNGLNVPIFLTLGFPFTEETQVTILDQTLQAENFTCCDHPIDLTKANIEYTKSYGQLTDNNCTALKEQFNVVTTTESHYIEELLLNDTLVHCLIHNDEIEYVSANKEKLEEHLLKYYPRANGYFGELIAVALFIAFAIYAAMILQS